MRTYKVQVNGRTYTVSIEQVSNDKFRITMDGLAYESEVLTREEVSRWIVRSDSRSVRAQSRILPNDKVSVSLSGVPFLASVQPIGLAGYSIEKAVEKLAGGQVRAPMPGRVTSILVGQGDSVDVDTPLLVIEAMKMQNEIVSPLAGKVKSVLVQEGSTIKKDSLLIEIEGK